MNSVEDANESPTWVDGNAAAGILASVFVLDATMARIICANCGHDATVAEHRVFALELGAVFRCPRCTGVTLRISVTPHGWFMDMSGAHVVHFVRPRE